MVLLSRFIAGIRRRPDLLAVLVLAALVIGVGHRAVLTLDERLPGLPDNDVQRYHHPRAVFRQEALLSGSLPLWNPNVCCGLPFLALNEAAVFYPLTWLSLPLSPGRQFCYGLLLHALLGGGFFYLLMRRLGTGRVGALCGAITYIFAAPLSLRWYQGGVPIPATAVWLPLGFYLAERWISERRTIFWLLLGGVLAAQFFAGHAQSLYYGSVALLMFFFYRTALCRERPREGKTLGRLWLGVVGAALLAVALAAVQLLPTMEMVRQSERSVPSREFSGFFSLPPENLLTLLAPDFFGDTQDLVKSPGRAGYWGRGNLWEMCAYAGVLPLVLAGCAFALGSGRYRRFFGVLGMVSIVLALGRFTPLFGLFYEYVPGTRLFRGPSKWLGLTSFSVAALAAFGLHGLMESVSETGRKRLRRLGWVLVGCSVVAAALVAAAPWRDAPAAWADSIRWISQFERDGIDAPPLGNPAFFDESWACARTSVCRFAVLLAAGGMLVLLRGKGRLSARVAGAAALLIIGLDLGLFAERYAVTFSPEECRWAPEMEAFFREQEGLFRVSDRGGISRPVVHGFQAASAPEAMGLARHVDVVLLSQGMPLNLKRVGVPLTRHNRITAMLGVKYVVMPKGREPGEGWVDPVSPADGYTVYRSGHETPRAFLVHDWRVGRSRREILWGLGQPEFKAGQVVFLETDPGLRQAGAAVAPEHVKVREYAAERVRVEARVSSPAILVLADNWYPDWVVRVDGEKRPLLRANWTLRGVALGPGRHEVVFAYEPDLFRKGARISVCALVIWIVGIAATAMWEKRRGRAASS